MTFLTTVKQWFAGAATEQRYGDQVAYPYTIEGPIHVDEDVALTLSAVYRAVQVTAGMVGSIPLDMVDSTGSVTANPIADLVKDKPNHIMTGQDFRETMVLNLMFHGNCYAHITRNAVGDPVSLWPLPAQYVNPTLNNGVLTYEYQKSKLIEYERDVVYSKDDVLHIKDMGNGIVGLSRIAYAHKSIGVAVSQENFTSDSYTSGGRPTSVIETEQIFTPEQRTLFKQNIASEANTSGAMLLEGGLTWKAAQLSLSDLETLAGRKYSVEDVARWFGVPLTLIGMSETAADRSTSTAEVLRGWLMTDLTPLLTKFENAFRLQLLRPEQRSRVHFKFKPEQMIRYDIETLMNIATMGSDKGLLTINEGRELIGKERMEGEEYDTLRAQAQYVEIGDENGTDLDADADTDTES